MEVEQFLRAKISEDAPGAAWVARMRWELRRFPALLRRVQALGLPDSVAEVEEAHILALRSGLSWEKPTFAIHFAALRQFLRWGENPLAEARRLWRLPSGTPSHRRWLTKEQLERLFGASEGRERLLVALEGLNGLRRVEVLRLRRQDVRPSEGVLCVLGKGRDGGKWRRIPMHPLARDLVLAALDGRAEGERLLPLSASGADLVLARAARRAGFVGEGLRVSHHDLRRTFGRVAYESGVDLLELKNLLGHSSVEMTVHYIGIDADRMRSALTRFSLAERGPFSNEARAPEVGRVAARALRKVKPGPRGRAAMPPSTACEKCDEPLPPGASVCPACGTPAGGNVHTGGSGG